MHSRTARPGQMPGDAQVFAGISRPLKNKPDQHPTTITMIVSKNTKKQPTTNEHLRALVEASGLTQAEALVLFTSRSDWLATLPRIAPLVGILAALETNDEVAEEFPRKPRRPSLGEVGKPKVTARYHQAIQGRIVEYLGEQAMQVDKAVPLARLRNRKQGRSERLHFQALGSDRLLEETIEVRSYQTSRSVLVARQREEGELCRPRPSGKSRWRENARNLLPDLDTSDSIRQQAQRAVVSLGLERLNFRALG